MSFSPPAPFSPAFRAAPLFFYLSFEAASGPMFERSLLTPAARARSLRGPRGVPAQPRALEPSADKDRELYFIFFILSLLRVRCRARAWDFYHPPVPVPGPRGVAPPPHTAHMSEDGLPLPLRSRFRNLSRERMTPARPATVRDSVALRWPERSRAWLGDRLTMVRLPRLLLPLPLPLPLLSLP